MTMLPCEPPGYAAYVSGETLRGERSQAAYRVGRLSCAQRRNAQSSVNRDYFTKSTSTPGLTMLASSSTSQLVNLTQPCDPDLSILLGSGVP